MELINTIISVSAIVICCILGWASDSQSKTIKVLRDRISRSERMITQIDYYLKDRLPMSKARKISDSPLHQTNNLKRALAISDEMDNTIKDLTLRLDYSLEALGVANSVLKANGLGTIAYYGVDMAEGKDRTVETHFNEKGEIIGAEPVEPFVQEGGEIEGFESAKGVGTLYDNADKFEDKEPKVDYKFTATQCLECGKELGLRDEDTGSDIEVRRTCEPCHVEAMKKAYVGFKIITIHNIVSSCEMSENFFLSLDGRIMNKTACGDYTIRRKDGTWVEIVG